VTKTATDIPSSRRPAPRIFDGSNQACPAAPIPPATQVSVVPQDAFCKRCVPRTRVSRGADGPDPLVPSAPPSRFSLQTAALDRRRLIENLGAQVRALEGGSAGERSYDPRGAEVPGHAPGAMRRPRPDVSASSPSLSPFFPQARADAWTLGEAAFDACLPGGSLDTAGIVELKPGDYGDWPTTLAFALCLTVRRHLALLGRGGSALGDARQALGKPVLWCTTPRFASEHGRLYGAGLDGLGLSPAGLIMVDAPRESDVLWALEEGLRSGGVALAVGLLKGVDLTPSRRLGLAASAGRTPGLLLTPPSSPPAPSASLRLRLRRLPGAPHPLDRRAPGAPRVRLTLERCRGASLAAETLSLDLEWCDVTCRFRLVADVADRAHAAPNSRQRA
jgi:protein ImuA